MLERNVNSCCMVLMMWGGGFWLHEDGIFSGFFFVFAADYLWSTMKVSCVKQLVISSGFFSVSFSVFSSLTHPCFLNTIQKENIIVAESSSCVCFALCECFFRVFV